MNGIKMNHVSLKGPRLIGVSSAIFGLLLVSLAQEARANPPASILAVGECKPYQNIGTEFAGFASGSYTNFRFSQKVCVYDGYKKRHVVRIETTIVDLGFFEDNDNVRVTNNLKARCEALREEAMGEIVNIDQTECIKVKIPLI